MKKIVSLLIIVLFLVCGCSSNKLNEPKEKIKTDFKGMLVEDVDKYAKEHDLVITKVYEFSDEIKKDIVIESNLEANNLSIKISKGSIPLDLYKEKSVNELGKVPIMMYHGIRKKTSTSTGTIGGNVDKDGYNRTPDAFREDLEFYYKNGYRMIRLNDYINDFIDVELGYSPIILTFDDGNADNFKVIGKNDDGSLDTYNSVTNKNTTSNECNQPDYNEEIIKWLVENGYDVGNHTKTHLDIKKSSGERVQKEIAYVYDELEKIIPDKYVKIIALPFGSPYKKTHENYKYVLETNYNDKTYKTDAALRVGWEPEVSPFSKYYDKTFLKRCRAYDIAMVFNMLKKSRFISDGEPDFITILESDKDKIKETDKKIITLKED